MSFSCAPRQVSLSFLYHGTYEEHVGGLNGRPAVADIASAVGASLCHPQPVLFRGARPDLEWLAAKARAGRGVAAALCMLEKVEEKRTLQCAEQETVAGVPIGARGLRCCRRFRRLVFGGLLPPAEGRSRETRLRPEQLGIVQA